MLRLLALLVALVSTTAGAPAQRPPNVLLYVTDDQGYPDAGCYGSTWVKTPGLDALARSGTRFSHAFCTTSSCSPSRSVILTGLHNHRNGQYGLAHSFHKFSTRKDVVTLPTRLHEAGYRTMAIGKLHVEPRSLYPFDRVGKKGAPTEMAARCRTLIAADDERPFFLYFGTFEPHRPFRRDGSDPVALDQVVVPPFLPDNKETRLELAHYAMSVQRADGGLVALLQILEDTGHRDDTLVIYVSDNGIPFPGAKTTMYEPGIRLPCVVRAPGQQRTGIVSDAMVSWVDITPTILDFAGALSDPQTFHGRSFRPVLEQEHAEDRDMIFASHTFHEVTMYYPMRVVRDRRYKLIWNLASPLTFPFAADLWRSQSWQGARLRRSEFYGPRRIDDYLHRPEFELYDLQEDPLELQNLAGDRNQLVRLQMMKRILRRFQDRTGDPWLIKWEHE